MARPKRRFDMFIAAAVAAAFLAEGEVAYGQMLPSEIPQQGKKYVLDFSDFPGGGVPVGNFDNLAFRVDLRQPLQKITFKAGERREDVIATFDYAGCTKGQEPLLERYLRELPRGNAAWVDYVDIEMTSTARTDTSLRGGVCYGYRKPSGTWYWYLAVTPLTYDATTNRIRARLWVKEPNVDALKIVFDQLVPRQHVSNVTITTRYDDAGVGR